MMDTPLSRVSRLCLACGPLGRGRVASASAAGVHWTSKVHEAGGGDGALKRCMLRGAGCSLAVLSRRGQPALPLARPLSILSKYYRRRDAQRNEPYEQTVERLSAHRRNREAEHALVEKAKATVAWQLLEAELAEAQAQIERKHALRRTAKSFARVRDECNVEVARARYEIKQRHFRLWEQRGLPLSRLFPSDGRTAE